MFHQSDKCLESVNRFRRGKKIDLSLFLNIHHCKHKNVYYIQLKTSNGIAVADVRKAFLDCFSTLYF